MPFRDAHEIVARIVRVCVERGCGLEELSLTEMQKFSALIKEDIFSVITLEGSVAARSHIGGTAPEQVRAAIAVLRHPS